MRCDEDDFGVPRWHDQRRGDTYHHNYHDPFERMLARLGANEVTDRAVALHGDLEVARSIALSIFGRAWRDHVWAVYERIRTQEPSE